MLVIKMFLMSIITAIQRTRHKVVISKEDLNMFRGSQVLTDDPAVERARSAHRNDLENILPYLIIGLLYVFTDPNTTAAMWLYRIGAMARILHTCVYAFVPVPQPARAICFFTTAGIMVYMSVRVFIHFF
ncbi:microsomal glutathione S-transferase 1-like [Culicoides brevitarsis]|uniref:microsomal glutathione S-transferase 1-like n=1 Tax=Culicoides brevitarsis TaxID=469753 RepID=UPI00307B63B3